MNLSGSPMRRGWRLHLVVCLLALGSAAAEEPARPASADEMAAKVEAAHAAADAEALAALASTAAPDPWLVVDALVARDALPAAEAFAAAGPDTRAKHLARFLAGQRDAPTPASRRRLLETLLGDAAPTTVLAQTQTIAEKGAADVVGIRLLHARALAYEQLKRLGEAVAAFQGAGEAAEALGWARRAGVLFEGVGRTARGASRLPAARDAFERAAGLYARAGDTRRAGRAQDLLASVHLAMGAADAALELFRRRLAASREAGDEAMTTRLVANLGTVLAMRGEHAKALPHLEEALERWEAAGNNAAVAKTLHHLGMVHRNLGRLPEALATLRRARELAQSLGDRRGAARVLSSIGNVQTAMGRYGEAREAQAKAVEELLVVGDHRFAAGALVSLGVVLHETGALREALAAWERALATQRELGNRFDEATTLQHIGVAHGAMGDRLKAREVLEEALRASLAMRQRSMAARALVNLGIVLDALGRPGVALARFDRAMAMLSETGDRIGAAKTLISVGSLHEGMGRFAKAIAAYEEAERKLAALGDKRGVAQALAGLGVTFESLGDRARARTYAERAHGIHEAIGNRIGAASSLTILGHIHLGMGEVETALELHTRALAAFELLEDRVGMAGARHHLGTAAEALGRLDEALAHYARALELHMALGDRSNRALTLLHVGRVHVRRGELEQAEERFREAERLAGGVRASARQVVALEHLARLHLGRDQSDLALGRAREGLRILEDVLGGLGEVEGAGAREGFTGLFEAGALAALRTDDVSEAVRFLESGRAGMMLDFLGKREALRWKVETLPKELLAADEAARAAQAVARHDYDRAAEGGDRAKRREAAKALDAASERVREVAGRIQRELKQQAGLFYPRPGGLDELQAVLGKDEALVLYGLCLEEALALVVRSSSVRTVRLGTRAEIEAAVAALDASDKASDAGEAATKLRGLIREPLALGKEVRRLIVSPEGALCRVPFGLLFDRAVALTPSGTTHALLAEEVHGPSKGVLALGDPDYGGLAEDARAIYVRGRPLASLPATRAEVEAVGTHTLLGANASEAGFREAVGKAARWRAVHIAGHGLVDTARPMLSSLALAPGGGDDGFLTALEILRMEIPTDLAVLSACDTGRGKTAKGEGIVGMARAWMFAGASRVVCSLWKVDDEATRALMVRFYAHLHGTDGVERLAPSEALRAAQAHVRSQPKWRHPYYWAAWVLWGLP